MRSLLSVGVVAGLLLLPAAPAAAASGITSPGAGELVTADGVLDLRAVVDGPTARPSELTLQAPDAETAEVVAVEPPSPSGAELQYDFRTACATRVCASRTPAVNGTWTLRLRGQASDERQFVLRIPPAAPTEVAAAPSESGVTVSWAKGAEPDLTGYVVTDRRGRVVQDGISLDYCDAEGVCQVEVPEDAGAWSVRALRSVCPGCREELASPLSKPVGARAAAPVLPAARPGQGGSADEPPAKNQPSRRADQSRAFARAFGGPVAPVAAPTRQTQQVTAQQSQQQVGAPRVQLGYGTREVVVRQPVAPLSGVQNAVGSALGSGDRTRLIVLSIFMIAGSLWLRQWLRRTVTS
jgi:hypothetical protein